MIAAIVAGIGGGLLFADMVSPKTPKQELTRLEQRMSDKPIDVKAAPSEPNPNPATPPSPATAAAPAAPAQPPAQTAATPDAPAPNPPQARIRSCAKSRQGYGKKPTRRAAFLAPTRSAPRDAGSVLSIWINSFNPHSGSAGGG